MWFAYAVMWISASLATCFGVYITKSAWCLWALILPASIKLSIDTSEGENKGEHDNEE